MINIKKTVLWFLTRCRIGSIYPYNEAVDIFMNSAIQNIRRGTWIIKQSDRYHLSIETPKGYVHIWIANRWYGLAGICISSDNSAYYNQEVVWDWNRPSFATLYDFSKIVLEADKKGLIIRDQDPEENITTWIEKQPKKELQ